MTDKLYGKYFTEKEIFDEIKGYDLDDFQTFGDLRQQVTSDLSDNYIGTINTARQAINDNFSNGVFDAIELVNSHTPNGELLVQLNDVTESQNLAEKVEYVKVNQVFDKIMHETELFDDDYIKPATARDWETGIQAVETGKTAFIDNRLEDNPKNTTDQNKEYGKKLSDKALRRQFMDYINDWGDSAAPVALVGSSSGDETIYDHDDLGEFEGNDFDQVTQKVYSDYLKPNDLPINILNTYDKDEAFAAFDTISEYEDLFGEREAIDVNDYVKNPAELANDVAYAKGFEIVDDALNEIGFEDGIYTDVDTDALDETYHEIAVDVMEYEKHENDNNILNFDGLNQENQNQQL